MTALTQTVVYRRDTGVVISAGRTYAAERLADAEHAVLTDQVAAPGEDYVKAGKVLPRPTLPATLKGNVLHGVPAGAEVTIEGSTYGADGTPIELEFALPGTYRIQVSHPPYLNWEISYEAPA